MRIGVSYNLFDGHELLRSSIKCIRDHVHFISIVYQEISNYGQKCDPGMPGLVKKLYREDLVDHFTIYNPADHNINRPAALHETDKRNIGLDRCRKDQCTHYLSIDVDEFYLPNEFVEAVRLIKAEGFDNTACQMQSYYRRMDMAIDPPEDYWVTFLCRIHPFSQFIHNGQFPVLVDPTRRMNEGKGLEECSFYGFSRTQLQMHHGSYVRKNIRSKLENSSAYHNFSSEIDRLVEYYEKWEEGDQAYFAGNPPVFHNLKKVNPPVDLYDLAW